MSVSREVSSSQVLENIADFRAGAFKELWIRSNGTPLSGSFDPIQKAISIERTGDISGAAKILTSRGLADISGKYNKLLDLHPAAPRPTLFNYKFSKSASAFSEQEFEAVVHKARWRKAADSLGW